MAFQTKYFLLFIILCHVACGIPISRDLKIILKCGDRHVKHAKVHFHEYESEHSLHPIRKVADFERETDGHGHFEFDESELKMLAGKSFKLTVRDTCDLSHKHVEKCNIPYHHYEVLMSSVPFHSEYKHTMFLDLQKVDEQHRSFQCL